MSIEEMEQMEKALYAEYIQKKDIADSVGSKWCEMSRALADAKHKLEIRQQVEAEVRAELEAAK